MKKLLSIIALAGFLAACNNEASKEAGSGDTTTVSPATPTTTDTSTATTSAPAVKDSMMQFKDGKVQISVGGTWSPLSAAVTTSNGRKVSPNGEVSKGAITRKMEEGMMIDKDGQMMDKDGKLMDNTGWE